MATHGRFLVIAGTNLNNFKNSIFTAIVAGTASFLAVGLVWSLLTDASLDDNLHSGTFGRITALRGVLSSRTEEPPGVTTCQPYPQGVSSHGQSCVSSTPLHLTPVCGTWQKDYIELHKSIRDENIASGKERFLVFSHCPEGITCGIHDCCSGVGDNLVGLGTTLMLSVLFRRALLVDWDGMQTEAFEPATVDWRLTPDLRLSPRTAAPLDLCHITTPLDNGSSVLVNLQAYNFRGVSNGDIFKCLESLEGVGTVYFHVNRGITHWTVQQGGVWSERVRRMGLRLPYIAGCMLRFLLRPVPEVEAMVEEQRRQLEDPNTFSVCLHVRYGIQDAEMKQEMAHQAVDVGPHLQTAAPLLACAQRLTDYWALPTQRVQWYVMSSSYAVKKAIKELHQDLVITTEFMPLHLVYSTNHSALRVAVAEWLLYSKCNFFVFHNSGLSKSAAMFSLRPMSAFSFARQPTGGHPGLPPIDTPGLACEPEHSSDLMMLGESRSGL